MQGHRNNIANILYLWDINRSGNNLLQFSISLYSGCNAERDCSSMTSAYFGPFWTYMVNDDVLYPYD